MRFVILVLAILGLAPFASTQSSAQSPPITLVVPFAAGGPLDVVARIVAEAMADELGATVIVENVAGAGGTIGATRVARAEPNGKTLLIYHIGMATSPALYKDKLRFDPVSDFEPVGLFNEVAMALIGRSNFSANNAQAALAYVRENPTTVTMAHAGVGSASHLCTVLMTRDMNPRPIPVAYRGTGPAMNDLVGGHLDVMCDLVTNITAQVQAATIKAFAVSSAKRIAALPDIPTAQEAGIPTLDMTSWNALFVPKGTPHRELERISVALLRVLARPQVEAKLAAIGAAPVPIDQRTPDWLRGHLASEIRRWTELLTTAGARAE